MSTLHNKVILITGAFGQAGQSAIRTFLQQGAIVIANDYKSIDDVPALHDLREQYDESRLSFYQADFFEEQPIKDTFAFIEKRYGRFDGLYHNVYASFPSYVADMTLEDWDLGIRGTLTSTFLANKYAIPMMIASGGGSIVNTSSVLGENPTPHSVPYGAGKAAVNHLTRIVAVTYAKQGIRANVLVPGDFKSEEVKKTLSAAEVEGIRRDTLLERSGTPEEINAVAAFLLSDASSFVTGSIYHADGGYRL